MADSSFDNTNETQQAQHSFSNDTPTDVNNNAALARRQAGTTANAGDEFQAGAARRNQSADAASERRQAMFDAAAAKQSGT